MEPKILPKTQFFAICSCTNFEVAFSRVQNVNISVSSRRYAHFQGSKGTKKQSQNHQKNSKKCEKRILKIQSFFHIDISLIFRQFWTPKFVQNWRKLQGGRPFGRFFSCHTFLSDDLVHLGSKMVPKITPKSKKLCISNPEMQENLIVFFVIDSGRMLVERNYAICQARVHRQRGTEVAVPTACQTPSFLTNFVFKLSQILDLRLKGSLILWGSNI